MTSAEGVASTSPRSTWLLATVAIVLSIALHVVPQLLRDSYDPAWSMLVLMVVDACAVALIMRSRIALVVGLVLVVLLGAAVWSHQQVMAALPSIALNLMLAGVFGATLRQGYTPLIVRIAEFDEGVLAPQFTRYLRGLTQAWAIFFAAMAALSLVLILSAPFEWWSLFVNVLMWPLVGMMFAAEWILRRVVFKELPPHTPLHIVMATVAYLRQVGPMSVARRSG